jgi:hypothetical protein
MAVPSHDPKHVSETNHGNKGSQNKHGEDAERVKGYQEPDKARDILGEYGPEKSKGKA